MKQHVLSFQSIPDSEEIEQQLLSNLDYFQPDNFRQDENTVTFTTQVALRGQAIECTIMSTRSHASTINQEY